MSERYEGVVFRSDESAARRAFASLSPGVRFRLVRLARGVFGACRAAGRADAFDQAGVERAAQELSLAAGPAVALFYDNGCGVRAGTLYRDGRREREFGDGDAWWVPYGPDGEPVRDGPRFRAAELRPGVECECVFSAIDAGLEAVGVCPPVSAALVKQAFCYGASEVVAEP